MRKPLAVVLLSWSFLASAGVLNIEFKFTPYLGDPSRSDHVVTVPGKAAVFINDVPLAEQNVEKREVPVLFDKREIGTAVWIPAGSMGSALRKGRNRIRVEFMPADLKLPYAAQLSWASVTDQVTRTEKGPGQSSATNQSDEGADNRQAVGKVVLERDFVADFAADLPWHHYPPVTALTDADRQALAALVAARAETFKPEFSSAYQILKGADTPGLQLDLGRIQKSRILHKGYAAGIRVLALPEDKLDLVVTGNPEVVIRGKTGNLFEVDAKALGRMKGEDLQMGMAMLLGALYPPQLVAVRDPSGKWVVLN